MKFGNVVITKPIFGLVAIQKVYFGLVKVWENWVYYISNFVTMTSNALPSPFVASLITSVTSGSAYQVFDNNGTTGISASYFAISTLGLGAKLLFGQSIRIAKIKARIVRSGQSVGTFTAYGIKEDNTKVLIYQGSIATASDVTVVSTDQTTPFKGIEGYVDTRTDLICSLQQCQVIEYWKKG